MGMYTGIAPMENSMENSQKIEIELLHDPATPFLGIYQKEMKTLTWKEMCTLMFIAALLTIA